MTPMLTLLVLALVGWFAVGTIWNVRKGSTAMRWMQGGLPFLGERAAVRWLGTTSVELAIRQAKEPFAQVTLVVFLEPRDVPWLWAMARGRGRRDTLIIRAILRRAPEHELDALDDRSWSGRDALRHLDRHRWSKRVTAPNGGPSLLVKEGDGAQARVDGLVDLARSGGMAVRRLSLQHAEPHLQLHVDLPALTADAAAFFRTIRAIGEQAGA